MTEKLYKIRWLLVAGSIGFWLVFAGTIHFELEPNEQVESSDMYKLLGYWWLGLLSFFLYCVAETYQGKTKGSSNTKKLFIMAFPTLFVLMASYVTSKFAIIT